MQHSTPAAPAVRETLERLLASETFGRSERARELLRYLVERQLAGEAERLKGFSIAVDVFGKDTDFDSSTDAVVRVQAGRLRELLNQYFATEGAAEPIRIAIPRGSYVPIYEANREYPLPAPPADPGTDTTSLPVHHAAVAGTRQAGPFSRPPMARRLRFFWGMSALVIAMLGVMVVRQGGFSPPGSTEAARIETTVATSSIAQAPSPVALPTVSIETDTTGVEADRVFASLRAGLSGFDTIDFIVNDTARRPLPTAGRTSFVFHIMPAPTNGGIMLELQNIASGRVLVSWRLQAADLAPAAIEDRIAGILTATVPASGAIYNYLEQNDLGQGLTRCLLLDEKYYLDQNTEAHETAYRCLEGLIRQDVKSPLVYSEIASLHLEAVTKNFAYPPGATADRAVEYVRHAVQMGSTSPAVHRSYGYINSRLGKTEAAIRWMRKAYELNTYDLGMAAAYGYSLIFAGNYSAGTPILARAVEASSARPTWWDFGLFAGKFMLGDMEGARRASDALTTTTLKSHYLCARIISAAASGDRNQVRQLAATLTTEFPKFTADPRKVFQERNYPADLTERMVKALRDAGIPDAS